MTPPKKAAPPPSRGRIVDAKTRERIVELSQQLKPDGKRWSQNAIAKECGCAVSTVARIVREVYPDHDWTKPPVAAVVAHARDMKAERLAFSETLMDTAIDLAKQLKEPHVVVGWYQGFASEHTVDKPMTGDIKNLLISIGIALDKHAMLVKFDSDDRDLPAVDAWHEHMTGGPVDDWVTA